MLTLICLAIFRQTPYELGIPLAWIVAFVLLELSVAIGLFLSQRKTH